MSKLVKETKQALRQAVLDAMGKAVADGALPPEPIPAFTVEVPADRANGDYATNAAMACAKAFHMAPRKIAEEVLARMDLADTFFSRCEAAGPGFLNFFLAELLCRHLKGYPRLRQGVWPFRFWQGQACDGRICIR